MDSREGVLYVIDVAAEQQQIPDGCQIEAWRPPGISEITEVFHAKIVDYGYPTHAHDTWTVLIVDNGAISYDLDRRQCGAVGDTVAILPPGVTHNGKPAAGANGFVKRVLYLDESVVPVELVGAAVDQTNIEDAQLRCSLASLHEELRIGADPFAASSEIALIAERITDHLNDQPGIVSHAESGVAQQLRLMLDESPTHPVTLDEAAARIGRTKAHLVRSFSTQYGVSPHAYVIGKRVERARKLLLDGVAPADVAAAVGFYDQAHFTRHFKRHTAIPPGAYSTSRS